MHASLVSSMTSAFGFGTVLVACGDASVMGADAHSGAQLLDCNWLFELSPISVGGRLAVGNPPREPVSTSSMCCQDGI